MRRQKNQKRVKHSIRKQFAALFILFMMGTIIACCFCSSLFLDDYYLKMKTDSLKNVYSVIYKASEQEKFSDTDSNREIQTICNKSNISMVIVQSDNKILVTSMSDAEPLLMKLWDNLFLGTQEKPLEKTEKYTIQKSSDKRAGSDFLEMWGQLDKNRLFLIRIPMESIEESAAIANRFFLYIGILVSILSVFIVYLITKRVTRPIYRLADISEQMRCLDFSEKYCHRGSNEITFLGDNINALSDTLQATISELKTANNELKKDIARKEEIDEMRKEFLSNVSHELKTPIALIQGYAEGLKDGICEDEESRNYYCEVINDETIKMNNMVKKLLELNEIEFGNSKVTMEQFDIVGLIREYLQAADILIRQNDARVSMNREDSIMVWADSYRINEVFNNYFTNAINHLEGNQGERMIDIKITETERNTVRVSVFNTGKPIPEESIDRIWEKFYKVDKARTREYGGSGVGLSIVKAIMDSMNQGYGVQNFQNGVEFWFELDKG